MIPSHYLFTVVVCVLLLYSQVSKSDSINPVDNVHSLDAYERAANCSHRFHMGCLLDVLEKVCGAVEEMEACINEPDYDQYGGLHGVGENNLKPKAPESIYKCCCSKAYEDRYENCKDPDRACVASIDKHLKEEGLSKHYENIKTTIEKPEKKNCENTLDSLHWLIDAIQYARGELRTAAECESLAPVKPLAKCQKNSPDDPPNLRSRPDLYCDTVIWQFKEMGASDAGMTNCPHAPDPSTRKDHDYEDEDIETEDGFQDIYKQAKSCTHRFHMGCFLDVLEKACEASKEALSCSKGENCEKFDEYKRFLGALVKKNKESIYKCCCTRAYKTGGYEKCNEPNIVCIASIENHIKSDDFQEHWKTLLTCYKQKDQSACKKALDSINWVMKSIQLARGEMWPVSGCQILAPPQPISQCGWHMNPNSRPIERKDLYCDTIIWQYKEMGAADGFMSECPDAPGSHRAEDSQNDNVHEEKEDMKHDPGEF